MPIGGPDETLVAKAMLVDGRKVGARRAQRVPVGPVAKGVPVPVLVTFDMPFSSDKLTCVAVMENSLPGENLYVAKIVLKTAASVTVLVANATNPTASGTLHVWVVED